MLLFLLPLLVPPITYGIPMATVLYQAHLAGSISGVILANLVPTVPFVILIMIPFVEQIDPRIEAAARVFGAGMGRLFVQVLVPLLTPGILAALLLVLVRTIAMFELTFLTVGADQPDAGGGAVLCGVRGRGALAAVDRRDGGGLHGHHAGLAADRAAVRQPDADCDAGEAVGRRPHGGHGEPPRAAELARLCYQRVRPKYSLSGSLWALVLLCMNHPGPQARLS